MKRLDVSFLSERQRCDAWLYLPEGEGPHPCVVVAHGMGGIRQVRLGAYGERFAQAGYAMLAFDYRHWGTSEGTPRYLCSLKRQQADINAAIDFAKGRPDIDPGRVALFGISFGGGHTVVVASKRHDLTAVITQGAFLDGRLAVPKNVPTLALALGLATAWTVDLVRTMVGLSPHYMKIVGLPGEPALLTHAGDVEGYNAMLDGPSLWANKVAARIRNAVPANSARACDHGAAADDHLRPGRGMPSGVVHEGSEAGAPRRGGALRCRSLRDLLRRAVRRRHKGHADVLGYRERQRKAAQTSFRARD
jgi:fermentation-respiration switch protein FrsA (DUF1100 family)